MTPTPPGNAKGPRANGALNPTNNHQEVEGQAMNTTLAPTSTTAKTPVRDEADLGQPHKILVPCDEPRCIWKGGHVVDDFDPAHMHYALLVDERGFVVEVNKASFEDSWQVWANLECEDGRTSPQETRDFLRALEIADDMAAALNEEQQA